MVTPIAKGLILGVLCIFSLSCIFSRTEPAVDETVTPILTPPLPDDSNKAVIFFYRPARFGLSGVSPTIAIYGNTRELLVGRLHNSGYTWIAVPPGRYTFKA